MKSDDSDKKFEVKNVIRRGNVAVHILDKSSSEIQENDQVHQFINWERRFDHMQQHSGQHLISALFEQEYNNKTKGKAIKIFEIKFIISCLQLGG